MSIRYLVAIGLLNLCGVIALSVYEFTRRPNVVYVDSNKLLSQYKGMIHAKSEYQKKAGVWQANVDTLVVDVQRRIGSFEKDMARLSAKERQLTKELINAKQRQLSEYQQAIGKQAQEEDARLTSSVIAEVNAYLKTYGEQEGYTIILAATSYGNVAYADQKLDVTDKVLEGLNKRYPGK